MPLYTYECEKCTCRHEQFRPSDQCMDPVKCPECCGKSTRVIGARSTPSRAWPLASVALAVPPKMVAEAEAMARKMGVPTHFQKTGEPVFESRSHRKKYCETHGYYDADAGYGDATRRRG